MGRNTGQSDPRLLAWWYFSIALGFVLLAINRMVNGKGLWLVALRVVIAAGFAVLGLLQLRTDRR